MHFNKPLLIYIPCYNSADTIDEVLLDIPKEMSLVSECLVIDNSSIDDTCDKVLSIFENNPDLPKLHLIRLKENLGYGGSQKFFWL